MCRSIRIFRDVQPPVTDEEMHAAALQYVRKVSGFRKPSQANREAFEHAVDEVASATARLLASLVTKGARGLSSMS